MYIRVFSMQNINSYTCNFQTLIYNLQKNRGSAMFPAESSTKFGRVFIIIQ